MTEEHICIVHVYIFGTKVCWSATLFSSYVFKNLTITNVQ